jgi:hypothetical protein
LFFNIPVLPRLGVWSYENSGTDGFNWNSKGSKGSSGGSKGSSGGSKGSSGGSKGSSGGSKYPVVKVNELYKERGILGHLFVPKDYKV